MNKETKLVTFSLQPVIKKSKNQRKTYKNPVMTLRTNITGRLHNVKKFVFFEVFFWILLNQYLLVF